MRPLIFYSLFQIAIALIYLIMMSVISFFHFLLDHKFQLIESWSVRNAWEIIGITKLMAFALMVKIVDVRFPTESHLKNIFLKYWRLPDWSIITFIIFTAVYFYFAGSFILNNSSSNFTFFISSFIGAFVFYGTDFFLIYTIEQAFPENRGSHRLLNFILFTFLFYLSTKILMPFHKNLSPLIFFNYITVYFIFEIFKEKWVNPLMYILLFACPMGIIWGFDPVWGQDYSILRAESRLEYSVILILWVLSIY